MKFDKIKEILYFNDGTYLRDILIPDLSADDENLMISHLEKLGVNIMPYEQSEGIYHFLIGKCQINMFMPGLEFDLDAREFTDIKDHELLINFLQKLSKSIERKIIITPEMDENHIILTIESTIVTWTYLHQTNNNI